jgi:hypothetical protein
MPLFVGALRGEPGRRAPLLGTLKATYVSRKALEMEYLSYYGAREENLEGGAPIPRTL